MADRPLVSVIIPVRGSVAALHPTVDSVVGQSYRNLEIILVSDRSKVKLRGACARYVLEDTRVNIVHASEDEPGDMMAAGFNASHGEYVAFVDCGDILDRRNVEYLLHALQQTDASMCKGRVRSFVRTESELVSMVAADGADTPDKVILFRHPLHAYESVVCRSQRHIDRLVGRRNTGALYFSDDNHCRMYRRSVLEDMWLQGTYERLSLSRGAVYDRLELVADLDVVLCNRLVPDHDTRDFAHQHDSFMAALTGYNLARIHEITPYRSYVRMVESYEGELRSIDGSVRLNQERSDLDESLLYPLRLAMGRRLNLICTLLRLVRRMERYFDIVKTLI